MSLTVNTRYEKLANAFENFNGYFAETPAQIKEAFKAALSEKNRPSIINIAINPSADRKAQVNYLLSNKGIKNFDIKNSFFAIFNPDLFLEKNKT